MLDISNITKGVQTSNHSKCGNRKRAARSNQPNTPSEGSKDSGFQTSTNSGTQACITSVRIEGDWMQHVLPFCASLQWWSPHLGYPRASSQWSSATSSASACRRTPSLVLLLRSCCSTRSSRSTRRHRLVKCCPQEMQLQEPAGNSSSGGNSSSFSSPTSEQKSFSSSSSSRYEVSHCIWRKWQQAAAEASAVGA